ncbi:MAG: hypothetical protein FWB72_03005 [Firmicutes bacterium]|nr:hypothetical protein [Bacillota bacterium]
MDKKQSNKRAADDIIAKLNIKLAKQGFSNSKQKRVRLSEPSGLESEQRIKQLEKEQALELNDSAANFTNANTSANTFVANTHNANITSQNTTNGIITNANATNEIITSENIPSGAIIVPKQLSGGELKAQKINQIPNAELHYGRRDRLRERMLREGIDGFACHEVIEHMLYLVNPRVDTNPIGHRLIEMFGSVQNVLEASPEELMRINGVSAKSAQLLSSLPLYFEFYRNDKFRKRQRFDRHGLSIEYFISKLGLLNHEEFHMLCLNKAYYMLHSTLLNRGTIDQVHVFIREIAEISLNHRSSFVVLAHNHPSGDPYPSKGDIETTTNIVKALAPLGVIVLDHIVVGHESYYSFRENGKIDEEDLFVSDPLYLSSFMERKHLLWQLEKKKPST